MDALSEVLKSVRLEGAVYVNAELTAPWCTRGSGLAIAEKRLGAADHVLLFHFLLEGRCKARLVDGGDVIEMAAGDVALFPLDDEHLMGSDLGLLPVRTDTLSHASAPPDIDFVHLRYGGGGAVTRFVCGYLGCRRSVCTALLEGLPRMLHVSLGDGRASFLLRELLRTGVYESFGARPGAQPMLARLAELIFVESLRRYVEGMAPGDKGWLAGMRDLRIGRALALIHGEPARAWTVDEIAREVALSRSLFAERFTALVGEPPMRYLMRWRLAFAAQTLSSGVDPISRVAERSGYESEAAFNRAFKREFGLPPAAWRKTEAGAKRAKADRPSP